MTTVSLVLPFHRQADHAVEVLRSYADALADRDGVELLAVLNGPDDGTRGRCEPLLAEIAGLRLLESPSGWGEAVLHGIAASTGDVICYTNTARTDPADLARVVAYAAAWPDVVVKASRRTRDSIVRRAASVLYNLECRALFDLPYFDVNGTPKAFPRAFGELLALRQRDDLIDVELLAMCRRHGRHVVEVPTLAAGRRGGVTTTNAKTAVRLYLGALRLARRMR